MVGRVVLASGILAILLFLWIGSRLLFWLSLVVVAGHCLCSWSLLQCARRGFARRLVGLRDALLYSRTLEKKLQNDQSVDAIERDDVDILIDKAFRGCIGPKDVPGWALCDIQQITEFQDLCCGETRGLDPDAQPTWLCLVDTPLMVGCPMLLAAALIMKVTGYYG